MSKNYCILEILGSYGSIMAYNTDTVSGVLYVLIDCWALKNRTSFIRPEFSETVKFGLKDMGQINISINQSNLK